MERAHTISCVTVRADGSDRYDINNVQHKYSKLPAWMFHGMIIWSNVWFMFWSHIGTIFRGRKGPAVFWEKEWGSVDSVKYCEHILSNIKNHQHHIKKPYLYKMALHFTAHVTQFEIWLNDAYVRSNGRFILPIWTSSNTYKKKFHEKLHTETLLKDQI